MHRLFNAEGTTQFYLPEGRWTHLLTDETAVGPCWLQRTLPLDIMPIYIRHNALLPRTEPASHIEEGSPSELSVSAYLDSSCHSVFRDDEGLVELSADLNDRMVTFFASRAGNWIFHLPLNVMPVRPVTVTTSEGPIGPVSERADGGIGYWSSDDGLRVRFRGSECTVRW